MKTGQKVSAVVCTLGRPSLRECLLSVFNQSYENLELIVVSPNREVEKTVSKLVEFAMSNSVNMKYGADSVKFLTSDKANVSTQRNIGVKHASGDIVAFIDDDAVADKNWISRLIKYYDDEEVMCVGGKIIPKFLGKVPDKIKNLPKEIYKGFLGETLLEIETPSKIESPVLWASNISFRKKIFDVIGGFDESLGKTNDTFLCEEEIDMQTRILERDYKIVYEPDSFVTHLIDFNKLTEKYFIKRAFWQGYSEVMKIRKYKNFQNKLSDLNLSQLEKVSNIKILELFFEFSSAPNFEKTVNKSYELGRILALSSLIGR